MALQPGRKIDRYEILEQAGAGGMGEVYRARDPRLDRIVAIKVLPESVADDPSFQARFEREARAVSGLNHPRICALHDVGHDDGVHFLVMEYLEGETLAARIERESLSLHEALEYGVQIAEALAAAHRAGVVHRDLKPGNVMLTPSGAKLLDFGLAKPLQDAAVGGATLTQAATAASPLTATGTVLGTFHYMAPEVLEGQEADARSDLFAFGALLHEMISRRKAFEGKTQASVAAAILKEDTRPLATLVPEVPAALDRLVRRCLAKKPDERWHSAVDLTQELRWIASGDGFESRAERSRAGGPRGSAWLAWSVAGVLAVVAGILGILAMRPAAGPPSRGAIRFEVSPPEGTLLRSMYEAAAPMEVSPDGRHVVFGVMGSGDNRLWLRTLDAESRPLPGTENGSRPFWSPDSRNIGFFTDTALRRIDINGGPPLTLCAILYGRGGTWNRDGTIVLAPSFDTGLARIAEDGGELQPVTTLLDAPIETSHRYPSFLPDGRHFTYLALGGVGAQGVAAESEIRLVLGSLDGDEPRTLLQGASNAVYAAGSLVYRRGQALWAQPFDADRREFTGEARSLAQAVHYDAGYERAIFSASDRLLAYVAGNFSGQLYPRLLDRSGRPLRDIGVDVMEYEPRFAPDGRRLAVRHSDPAGEQVWIVDLERLVRTRLTFDKGFQGYPQWSPDGEYVAYGSTDGRHWRTMLRRADGNGEPRALTEESLNAYPVEWSPDGRYLLLGLEADGTERDLWLMDLDEQTPPRPLLDGPSSETLAAVSPDGGFLAYTSLESGRPEVYVTRFPSIEGKWQVSGDGGMEPIWNVDGTSLFYRSTNHSMMEVPLNSDGSELRLGSARHLFDAFTALDVETSIADLSPDGTRFVISVMPEEFIRTPITVVVDWAEGR